jgi:hypothetical protein
MSGELEAAGALATAGAVAGVIEGREGGPPVEGQCLNCGAQLSGAFCSQCGQNARPLRKLTQLLGEFLHNLFHFDTKAWRTLPMVLFRPGTLTRDYIYGKRARYISPLATFLLCVFALFFVFSWVGGGTEFGDGFGDAMEITQEDVDEAREEVAQARAELAELEANPPENDYGAIGRGIGAVARAEGQLQRAEAQYAAQQRREAEASAAETAPDTLTPAADSAVPVPAEAQPAERSIPIEAPAGVRVGVSVDDAEVAQRIESGETRWQDELAQAARDGEINVNLGHPYLNERALQSLRNPDLALYRIQEAASKFSFLLAPLSLPFIALLFLWKRGVTFYDHVVYALYALSFASILFMTLMVGGAMFGGNGTAMIILSNTLLLVGLPVHTFFHLKGSYALGWWSALWRTFFMLLFAIFIATFFLLFVLILGLAG